jgi:hypothetical protein
MNNSIESEVDLERKDGQLNRDQVRSSWGSMNNYVEVKPDPGTERPVNYIEISWTSFQTDVLSFYMVVHP